MRWGTLPVFKKAARLVRQNRHADVEQCHVDMLPCARAVAHFQRGEDGGCGVDAGEHIRQRHTHPLRAAARHAVGLAGDAHHAAHGLNHQVVTGAFGIRAVLPETGDGAINQARVERFEAVVIQPIVGQAADFEVFYQNVAVQSHLPNQGLAFRFGDINGDGAFIAVASCEIAGVGGVVALFILQKWWPPVSGVVALCGTLDFDDISPQVRQHLGTPRAGEHAG